MSPTMKVPNLRVFHKKYAFSHEGHMLLSIAFSSAATSTFAADAVNDEVPGRGSFLLQFEFKSSLLRQISKVGRHLLVNVGDEGARGLK